MTFKYLFCEGQLHALFLVVFKYLGPYDFRDVENADGIA